MKLSFLITYHDEGAWLSECLQSIVPQLRADDEVIVYDDASTNPAARYVLSDARVRCIRGSGNIGPARGRNELIKASTGTHIHFHDADDLCAATWRDRVAAAFDDGTEVVFTDLASFNATGEFWPNVTNVKRLADERDLLAHALRGGMLTSSGTYRRDTIESIGGYRADLWQSEDYDFHIRLALAQPAWRVIPEDLVHVRRHGEQRSRFKREVWSCAVDSLEHNAGLFPASAHTNVARAATRAGSQLFAIGAKAEAKRAFNLAERFGGARYDRGIMQTLTGVVGALSAEQIAALYRRMIPAPVRARVPRAR